MALNGGGAHYFTSVREYRVLIFFRRKSDSRKPMTVHPLNNKLTEMININFLISEIRYLKSGLQDFVLFSTSAFLYVLTLKL